MQPDRQRVIWTVGHGGAPTAVFLGVLGSIGIETIVDVRRFPGSRRHPHFGRDEIEAWLSAAGVAYLWMEALGGRRRAQKESPHVAVRNPQFRAYADHMSSAEFTSSIAGLAQVAGESRSAVMCSESVWWRCHRRLLADHLVLVEGIGVAHLLHDGRTMAHRVTAGARLADRHIVYDAA